MPTSVEKQIDNYLSHLSVAEKKTVLNVVKTIAFAKQDYDNIWKDEFFKKEIDKRTAEYENGTARLYKFEEMKNSVIANHKKKKQP